MRLRKKSQLVLVFLLLCNSLIAVVGAEQAFAGTFGGSASVDVTANATKLALADLTLTNTSQNYAGQSATFAITSPAATEILSLQTVGSASTTLNAISVVGSTVFRGTGSGSTVIGAIDGTLDGTAGKNLKINFTNSFVNGDFSDATVVSTVGSIVTLNGWTVYLQRAYLAGGSGLTPTTIAGWPAPADSTFPTSCLDRTPKYRKNKGFPYSPCIFLRYKC
jgi:trimeric autotransporter adhesin